MTALCSLLYLASLSLISYLLSLLADPPAARRARQGRDETIPMVMMPVMKRHTAYTSPAESESIPWHRLGRTRRSKKKAQTPIRMVIWEVKTERTRQEMVQERGRRGGGG
eukprot:3653208-Rhodomonas_salina.4